MKMLKSNQIFKSNNNNNKIKVDYDCFYPLMPPPLVMPQQNVTTKTVFSAVQNSAIQNSNLNQTTSNSSLQNTPSQTELNQTDSSPNQQSTVSQVSPDPSLPSPNNNNTDNIAKKSSSGASLLNNAANSQQESQISQSNNTQPNFQYIQTFDTNSRLNQNQTTVPITYQQPTPATTTNSVNSRTDAMSRYDSMIVPMKMNKVSENVKNRNSLSKNSIFSIFFNF